MMKNPFQDLETAFEPFYAERVVLSGRRDGIPFSQTIPACVFRSETGDELSEEAFDTRREDIAVVVRRRDWAFARSLRRGDFVERPERNGLKYTVVEVRNDDLMGQVVQARSV